MQHQIQIRDLQNLIDHLETKVAAQSGRSIVSPIRRVSN